MYLQEQFHREDFYREDFPSKVLYAFYLGLILTNNKKY